MTSYPPRVRRDFEDGQRGNSLCTLAIYATGTSRWGWGFHTLRGGIDPGNLRLCSRVKVAERWMIFLSGDETASSPGAAGHRSWPKAHLSRRAGSMRQQPTNGVGLHTVRGGIDPGDLRFSAKDVGVLQMLKDFLSGDEKILSPGATGPRSWQEGQLSSRAVSISPG